MQRRLRRLASALASCLVASPLAGQSAQPVIRPGDIVAANIGDNSVSVFDGETGAFRGYAVAAGAGGLLQPTGIAFGPDGALYVGSSGNDRILRYDGETGEFLGVFAAGEPLERPFSLIFGPGGDLFVSSIDVVLRYDREGEFAGYAARDSSLSQPIGLAFDADGMLYVANSGARNISRFDPATGALDRVFAADSLSLPSDVVFGPDGDMYVSSAASYRVVRFDGSTGAFEEIVATLPDNGVPMGLAFRADRLVVGDFGRSRLFFLDAPTRAPNVVANEGLVRPENIAIRPRSAPDSGPEARLIQ